MSLTIVVGMGMSCSNERWPTVACTPEELGRLRDAYKEGGDGGAVVQMVIDSADQAVGRTIPFPPGLRVGSIINGISVTDARLLCRRSTIRTTNAQSVKRSTRAIPMTT